MKKGRMKKTTKRVTPGSDWWRGCAIYQIYPRSYQDTTGDGSGDLQGVTRRLAHVASLGVDAIWLSPFFKSPMDDMGYDVSDYCDVDPMFGTLADFDAMIAEAHRLGLKVIIDQVLSHSSDRHPWFVESRSNRHNDKADWYVWANAKPDGSPPTNWLSVFGGPAWEWDSVRRQYYLHNFLPSQPDLNFHNPAVWDALLETVRFWLDRGVDGFRLDTVNFYVHDHRLRDNPPLSRKKAAVHSEANPYNLQDHVHDKTRPENIRFLKRFRALLDEYGARAAVGEVGDGARSLKTVASYTADGDKLHMCYTFDLLGPQFSPQHFRRCVEDFEAHVKGGWICWAFSNHDVNRHVSRWTRPGANAGAVARFAVALLCSLRGSICLYQGEELGLTEAEIAFEDLRDPPGIRFWPGYKGRDGCRTPMVWESREPAGGFTTAKPWLPVPAEHRLAAVDVQEADPASILNAYRAMLKVRQASKVLREGSIAFLGKGRGEVLAFEREADGRRIVCAFNFSSEEAKAKVAGAGGLKVLSTGGADGVAVATRAGFTLPPLGWVIAET